MSELDWGRKFLLCPPDYFGVLYEINPWMNTDVTVDRELARVQWDNLVAGLTQAGAELEFQQPEEGWPDLVFTANAGIVNGQQFVPTHFKHPERQGETRHDTDWAQEYGLTVDRLPLELIHEGAGDALPFGAGRHKQLVSGFGTRSEAAAVSELSRLTGAAVRSVRLVDPRLYHLDLTFTPLSETQAMIAPMAFDRHSLRSLLDMVPDPLILEDEEALSFCCNSVVVGKNIVMPNTPVRVGKQLEKWGFNIITVPVTEFMKGGGGARCLTLALDVTLNAQPLTAD